MTPLALWAAICLVALVATVCWAIVARDTGVYVTSALSFTLWGWAAIVGGDVALVNVPGGPIWVRETTASLQFTCLALALVSLVVLLVRLTGAYPSSQATTETDESEDENRTR